MIKKYYQKPATWKGDKGRLYYCSHPLYNKCTLYFDGEKGLAVIQQRFDPITKYTWWSNLDPWLVDDIYNAPDFHDYFEQHATPRAELYCTVTVRQIMRAVGLPPMKKEAWESRF